MLRHVALFRWRPETTSAVQAGNADFALVADAVLPNLIRPIMAQREAIQLVIDPLGLTLP